MALFPYTLFQPIGSVSPLIVDSPHSGRIYPVDFVYACPLPLLRQLEDAYVDEIIIGAVEAGATVLTAQFPRSMIDVNRGENDIDPREIDGIWPQIATPESMQSGLGLIQQTCRNGVRLYPAPLTVAEVRRRIDLYYRPYHACLRQQIVARIKQFGNCYLMNAHSMPDRIDNRIPRPDFILGDRDGTSCASGFTRCVRDILQAMGYSVGLNAPYKGREIVRRYGAEGQGAQALQIEINRRLYLDEDAIEKHTGFDQLQKDMTEFFAKVARIIETDANDRLAAE